jgi:hypothetical protein
VLAIRPILAVYFTTDIKEEAAPGTSAPAPPFYVAANYFFLPFFTVFFATFFLATFFATFFLALGIFRFSPCADCALI